VENLSYENEFDLPENEPVGRAQFQMDGSPQRIVLTQAKGKLGNGLFHFFI